jgi:deoxyribodipyrimidine photo-lyase
VACSGGHGEDLTRAHLIAHITHAIHHAGNGLLGPDYSSKFSPWLATGALSPRLAYQEIKRYEGERVANDSTYWLFFELLWRDFFRLMGLVYGTAIFKVGGPQGDPRKYPWVQDARLFEAWKEGQTGYPFVDANMR